jgi:hypothetical protein
MSFRLSLQDLPLAIGTSILIPYTASDPHFKAKPTRRAGCEIKFDLGRSQSLFKRWRPAASRVPQWPPVTFY